MIPSLRTLAKSLLIVSLVLSACAQAAPQATPEPGSATEPSNTSAPVEAAPATQTPPPEPTPTVWPPVFDPDAIGDNRVLDSFELTVTDDIVGGSSDGDHSDAIRYIKEPLLVSHTASFSFSGSGGELEEDSYYLIDGFLFTKDGQNGPPFYYYAHFLPPADEVNYWLLDAADMRQGSFPIHLLESAEFVAQEDYLGIPANHFTFDETNLGGVGYIGDLQNGQGDVYLAQGENYLLFIHFNVTGSEASREFTAELTSINQLTEISLPADFPVFELNPAIPFPEGTIFWSVQEYEAEKIDYYDNFVPLAISNEDFLDFYRNLADDSPWSLVEIGNVSDNFSCEDRECVTLTNGVVQVIIAPYLPDDFCVSTMPSGYGCVGVFYKK
ncbi:MAG: hypothetical protein WEC37_03820 [Anaerolineales bacterium]